MQLIYSEIYEITANHKHNCYPKLSIAYLEKEKKNIPKFEAKAIEHNIDMESIILYLPFSFGLFRKLSLETTKKLDTLLDFSYNLLNVKCIDKNAWDFFIATSNIYLSSPNKYIHTYLSNSQQLSRFKNANNFLKNDKQHHIFSYYSNSSNADNDNIINEQLEMCKVLKKEFLNNENKNDKVKFNYDLILNNDVHISPLKEFGVDGGIMYKKYVINFTDELNLVYSFLDCIFSTKYSYKLLKCENCKKFFINLNSNKKHCPLCTDVIIRAQKANYEKPNLVKLERKINSLYNSPTKTKEQRDEYLRQKQKMKAEHKDDELAQKNWYLQHYATEEARKRNDYPIP